MIFAFLPYINNYTKPYLLSSTNDKNMLTKILIPTLKAKYILKIFVDYHKNKP